MERVLVRVQLLRAVAGHLRRLGMAEDVGELLVAANDAALLHQDDAHARMVDHCTQLLKGQIE